MRRLGVVQVSILALAGLLGCQTSDDNWKRCVDPNPDLGIAGCTALIQSGRETNENLSREFNNRGNAYYSKASYDRAIQDYDEAIRLNPSYAKAFCNRGNAYNSKANYNRAIQDYNEAIRLNPGYANAYFSRGSAYNSRANYNRAIQDYNEAIRLNPGYANAFFSRGSARFYLGQFAAAQPDFVKAAELDSCDACAAIWLYLSRSRAGQDGRSELAKNAAQLKLTEWPGPIVNLYLGKTTPEAVLSAATNSDAKKDREQHCEAYFHLGEYALLGGKAAEAKRLFQKAIDTGVTDFYEYTGAQAELKRMPASLAKTIR